jgi:quinol-cytochrome oxidoreductase complex cytochrome b subunit
MRKLMLLLPIALYASTSFGQSTEGIIYDTDNGQMFTTMDEWILFFIAVGFAMAIRTIVRVMRKGQGRY